MEIDYQKLGFKCGIEIHQQLEGKKLFCKCPTLNSNKEPDIKVERRLRASAGELGKIDIAAKHEMEKGKKIIYIGNSEDVCLVELDEQPPYPVNKEALETALQVALLLNAKIIDEIQVMRKTVVDGSNTSGFQRTALIATDGHIETSLGKVRIPVICLEEEACQKVKEDKESITYRLDRLGIPLIEIATEADIKTAEHAKETASILGMILRSTDKVKRGIGTIRQDVNISIKGGARTEIKGFQELKSISKVIDYEIKRQLNEIKKGKKLKEEVRKAETDFTTSFLRPMPGADRMYVETDVKTIKITSQLLSKIKKPELMAEKIIKLEKKYSLDAKLAKAILKSGGLEFFKECADSFKNINPSFIADTFVSYFREILRRHKDPFLVKNKHLREIFSALNHRKISKNSVIEILVDISAGKGLKLSKYELSDSIDLEQEIKKIIKSKPGLSISAYMGLIMAKFKGKVDGKKAMEILTKDLKAHSKQQ